VLALAAPAGAGASAKEPPPPRPVRLWKAYPLDAPRGDAAQPGARIRSSKPGPAARSSEPAERSSLLLWISLCAFAAAVVAIVISWRAHLAWARGGVKSARQRAARLRTTRQKGLPPAAHAARTARQNGPVDDAAVHERALLKRKQATATSESLKKLKEKKREETRERYKPREIGVLKAKLADRPPAQ